MCVIVQTPGAFLVSAIRYAKPSAVGGVLSNLDPIRDQNEMTLTPQIIGRAENAHRAILNSILVGRGLTYPLRVTLTLVVVRGAVIDRERVVDDVTDALHVNKRDALQAIEQLASMGILNVLFADECRVMLTDHGRSIYRDVREAIEGIVSRVYDGVPTNDLAIAGRVLTLLTTRANAELAALDRG